MTIEATAPGPVHTTTRRQLVVLLANLCQFWRRVQLPYRYHVAGASAWFFYRPEHDVQSIQESQGPLQKESVGNEKRRSSEIACFVPDLISMITAAVTLKFNTNFGVPLLSAQ